MRLLPGVVRSLAKLATAAAFGLVVIDAGASAQQVPTAPSALDRACAPTELVGPQTLSACLFQASVRASRAARHLVIFETGTSAKAQGPVWTPETAALFADAAKVTSEAVVNIAGRPGGMSALARITDVRVAVGAEPAASLADGVLKITLLPSRGIAGRPSTAQIEQAALTP
jgi:Domain of unknown function (DUF4908)